MRDHVVEGDGAGSDAGQRGLDANEIVEACRSEVAHTRFRDGEAITFRLQRSVAPAQGPHVLDAADLTPHQEVRVIHDAHAVGFGVAHAQLRRVCYGHRCARFRVCVTWRSVPGTDTFVKPIPDV